MKNLMERGVEIMNVLGLIFGAIAMRYLGYEINNSVIALFGTITSFIFSIALIFYMYLLIRDLKKHGLNIVPRNF